MLDPVRWITEDAEILAGMSDNEPMLDKNGKLRLIDQTKLPEVL